MDIVARYNIQTNKNITPLQRAAANYESDGSPLDNWILQRKEMYQKLIVDKKQYDELIEAAAGDIYKELVALFKDFK